MREFFEQLNKNYVDAQWHNLFEVHFYNNVHSDLMEEMLSIYIYENHLYVHFMQGRKYVLTNDNSANNCKFSHFSQFFGRQFTELSKEDIIKKYNDAFITNEVFTNLIIDIMDKYGTLIGKLSFANPVFEKCNYEDLAKYDNSFITKYSYVLDEDDAPSLNNDIVDLYYKVSFSDAQTEVI